MCSVLWLLPPSFKNDAILLSLSNCVLPVFSLCRPLVFLPSHNNCIPLSVRLYPTNTPSIQVSHSKNQKGIECNWRTLAPEKKKKIVQTLDFTEEEDRNRHSNEWLEWYIIDVEEGGHLLWNDVFWVDCEPSNIRERRWRKSLGKTEKYGDDEEEEERKIEAKSLLHVRMFTSLLFMCTVLLLVLCFLTCVWFCVGVTFCFMFYVFVLCAALYFLTFLFCVAFVCTTPGSNSLHTTYGLFYPTQVQKNCNVLCG